MFSVNTNAQKTLTVLREVGEEKRREKEKEGEKTGGRDVGRSLPEGGEAGSQRRLHREVDA